jgi:hypothetical protein
MLAKLLLILLTFQSLCMTSAASAARLSDDINVRLNKQLTNYNLGLFSFVEALIRVGSEFQIPMGITWVNTPTAKATLPFAWKNATVQEVIEAIAKTQPGYQVQVKNGVLHVFPGSLIPDQENFLKLKIDEFSLHDTYIELASFKLHMLVTPRVYGQISIGGTGDSKVSVELKHPTLEDALDALAVASNRKIWLVTYMDDAGLTPRGLRRTRSLWTDQPIPDDEQPTWQLMRWGDPTPPLVASAKQ